MSPSRSHGASRIALLTSRGAPARHAGLVASLAVAGIAACSSAGGTPDPIGPGNAAASIRVSLDTVALTADGQVQLTARAVDAEGNDLSSLPVSYSVSNSAVASVSQSGLVSARRLGAASVKVTAGGASAEVPVVVRFDSVSFERAEVPGGPFGVASFGDTFLVTQHRKNTVALGSIAEGTVAAEIPVGSVPTDVAVRSDGTIAYVTNQHSNSLGIIDLASRKQVASVALGATTFRVVLSKDEKAVWVTTSDGRVVAVDPATRGITRELPKIFAPINGLVIAPGDTLAYASTYLGTVTEFDLRSRKVRRTFEVSPGQTLQEVVVSGDGKELYIGNENGYVIVLDLGTGREVTRLDMGSIFGMAIGPDGNTLFVAKALDGTIAAIDRTTRRTIFSAHVGGAPRRVKFDPEGRWILVANEHGWVDILR